jgi:hypothetical protein
MDIKIVRNSIRNVVAACDAMTIDKATDYILMIVLTEACDAEFRVCVMWASTNRPDYEGRMISQIKDMRQVFPGLGLRAARDFVRGY